MASLSACDFRESRLPLPLLDATSWPPPRAFPIRVTGRRLDFTASASAIAARPAGGPWRASTAEAEEKSTWVSQEELDDWIFRSVKGIVRDLRQAPLFVHVYSHGGEDGDVSLVTEKSVKEEDWEKVKGEWGKGDKALPEGVIFVEELEDDEERMVGLGLVGRDVARTWGLVVQGRGGKRGPPVCYLMKTSRVGSGTGVWSTHFYLVRVNGFRESARSQLMNFWLCDH